MKIRITKGGIYNAKGEEIKIGEVLDVGKEPTDWAGRYEVVGAAPVEGKTIVTGDKPKRADVLKEVAKKLKPEEFKDGVPDVVAINRNLPKDTDPFSAEEIAKTWTA